MLEPKGGLCDQIFDLQQAMCDLTFRCRRPGMVVGVYFAMMILGLHRLRSCAVGLALSGGSVRGLAHIGVIKALTEMGIQPAVIAGTSAGSLVGAAIAAGMDWHSLEVIAHSIFWPSLLDGRRLERFCTAHLPDTFAHLLVPFAAVATTVPSKRAFAITRGQLASAISASCAMRVLRRPVVRDGQRLKDGGIACVMPTKICRALGADFVIASDVWELSSVLRSLGCRPSNRGACLYPAHYRQAFDDADLLIQPAIPLAGYLPNPAAVKYMIATGEKATRQALAHLSKVGARSRRRRRVMIDE